MTVKIPQYPLFFNPTLKALRALGKSASVHELNDKVVEMMNLYTSYVTERIAAAGGIIDKLVGDGVNAFYPADPRRKHLHARAGLISALYILSELKMLDDEFLTRGFGTAAMGIGLHSGSAVIGNMGCERKLDYTAVGDTVNVAARLQELSKKYRNKTESANRGVILITAASLENAQVEVLTESIGPVPIRGRDKTEEILFIDAKAAEDWTGKRSAEGKGLMELILEGAVPAHSPANVTRKAA